MLAIVIPYYRKTFFKEALQSLSDQTDKRFNVYIGDDASPADPKEFIKQFSQSFRITYKRFDSNLGSQSLVQHWDRCIAMTQNEDWIMILGDDDFLSKNLVEEFYKSLQQIDKLKNNVVKFATKVVDKRGSEIYSSTCKHTNMNANDAFYEKISDQSRSSLSEHIFRKKIYKKYGFRNYKLAWHADDMAWLEFSNFKNISCIDKAFVSIRVFDNSISGTSNNQKEKNKASYQFYSDLILRYLTHFNQQQKNLIIRIFESKQIFQHGKTLKSYTKISLLYLKNFFLISFIRFTFRFFF